MRNLKIAHMAYSLFPLISKTNLLTLTKSILFLLVSIYLLGNFIPFYDSNDGYTLGTMAIQISKGNFEMTNELLEKTGRIEFVPGDWAKTFDDKHAIPLGPIGFHGLVAISYFIGGNFALFFLGPIFGIFSLIIADRLASKYFGESVGFLTLLFLITNHLVYRSFSHLQTEGVFNFFLLIGCFYILKYFHNKNSYFLLIGSIFFSISSLMRINGVVLFPVELILIIGFFTCQKFSLSQKNKYFIKRISSSKISKKFIAISFIFLFVPWSAFFAFSFSFNDHYFGDPFTNQRIVQNVESDVATINSIFSVEDRHLENFKQFSKYLLPYQFPAIDLQISDSKFNYLEKNWLGIISILFLISSLIISIKIKTNRTEIIVFQLIILGTIWFYASLTSESRALAGVPGRYMMPAFTLFYIILGFILLLPFNHKNYLQKYFHKNTIKIMKIALIISLIFFFSASLYFTPPITALKNGDFEIKNPHDFSFNHPPFHEGISKSDIVLAIKTDRILEYDIIPFTIIRNENGLMPDYSIDLLNEILDDNNSVYIFKKSTTINEKIVFLDLIENHNFIFKEHSSSFCSVEIKTNENSLNTSDSICLK